MMKPVDLLAIGLIAYTVWANPADPGVYIAVVGTVLFFWGVTRNLMRKVAHLEIAERAEQEYEQSIRHLEDEHPGFRGFWGPSDEEEEEL